MLNRRELIISTVALSVAAQTAAAPAPGGSASTGGTAGSAARIKAGPARYFVTSRNLPEAVAAARAAEARGETVVWLDTDVTPAYVRLDLELRAAPFAVAGLTSAHQLFVLERLGWDRGLRTVRRAELGTAVEWRLEPRKLDSKKGSDAFFGVS